MNPDARVALVTGGARRVGRAIALELAQAGCDVAIHYRSSAREAGEVAEQVESAGRRAMTLSGDLTQPSSWPEIIETVVSKWGRLDILVNNAAMFLTDGPDDLESFDPAHWEKMLLTNVTAPVGLCHYAAKPLRASGRGKIVNLCDAGVDRPWPGHLAYCASKAALACTTKALAKSLAPEIQVHGVAPGIAAFPDSYDSVTRARLVERIPAQRPGTSVEVARLVRFLVEHGDYMTGEVISIDGGRNLV